MLMEILAPAVKTFQPILPEVALLSTIFIAYWYAIIRAGFCSDDLAGIADYNGLLQTRDSEAVLRDPNLPGDQKEKQVNELNKRPLLKRLLNSEYGMISRWLRYQICGGNFPSSKKTKLPDGKDGDPIPSGKLPWRHHLLIVVVFSVASVLTYEFFKRVLGVKLALLAMLLFVVHPVGVQSVAWCSALGYPLSLLWIGAMLNFVMVHPKGLSTEANILWITGFAVLQFFGIHAQFIPMMTWAILLLLGQWKFAALGFVISLIMSCDIIKQTIDLRKSAFREQNMGESTHVKPRKLIVALKSLWYYLKLIIWPNQMGLYHKWGFHYGPDLEREDKKAIGGLLILAGIVAWFFLTPVFAVKLGLLWFSAFIFIFLNWVTIQQFVTERYAFIPSLGICLLVAYYTQNYLAIYGLIFGLLLCRTWLHLPTYDNELRFYQSNIWNFPDSEVAYGNLGVTQLRIGQNGSAMDSWQMSTVINPDYDVPWYNMFSHYRAKAMESLQKGDFNGCLGQLQQAMPYLQKTLQSKICHFPDNWNQERAQMELWLGNPGLLLQGELGRLQQLSNSLNQMMAQAKDDVRRKEVQISIDNNNVQIRNITNFISQYGIQLKSMAQINSDFLLSKLTKETK